MPVHKTVWIASDEGVYRWATAEGRLAYPERACVMAVAVGHTVGDPAYAFAKLTNRRMTPLQRKSISHLDNGEGLPHDVKTIRNMARMLKLEVRVVRR